MGRCAVVVGSSLPLQLSANYHCADHHHCCVSSVADHVCTGGSNKRTYQPVMSAACGDGGGAHDGGGKRTAEKAQLMDTVGSPRTKDCRLDDSTIRI